MKLTSSGQHRLVQPTTTTSPMHCDPASALLFFIQLKSSVSEHFSIFRVVRRKKSCLSFTAIHPIPISERDSRTSSQVFAVPVLQSPVKTLDTRCLSLPNQQPLHNPTGPLPAACRTLPPSLPPLPHLAYAPTQFAFRSRSKCQREQLVGPHPSVRVRPSIYRAGQTKPDQSHDQFKYIYTCP